MRFQCNNCMSIVAIEDSEMGQPVACGNCGKVVVVPANRMAPGAVVDDFVIERWLGTGGLASVYLAHQLSLDRPVALKILHDEFASDPEFINKFINEARAAAQLNHPNIVQAFAVGEEQGICFFAMEYVHGNTLKNVLSHSGRFVAEQALRVVQEIATALDFAWTSKQLVHRDIKPDNIIITEDQKVKLADLGLARVREDLMEENSEDIFGTPQYVAPEQLVGYPADHRSDIYSLGATLFHLVTGQCPYRGSNPAETARKHLFEPLPSPGTIASDLPDPVCRLIRIMMIKRPGQRYQTAAELLADLALVQAGQAPSHALSAEFEKPLNMERIDQEMKLSIPTEPVKKDMGSASSGKLKASRPTSRGTGLKRGTSRKTLKRKAGSESPGQTANDQQNKADLIIPVPANSEQANVGTQVEPPRSPAPPAATTGSSRKPLKVSANSARATGIGGNRKVRRVRKSGASSKPGNRSGKSKKLILLVLLILTGAVLATLVLSRSDESTIEARFNLDVEQTRQLQEIENELEDADRETALRTLRSGLDLYQGFPQAQDYLLSLAAPRLEQQARERRAELRSRELNQWRERSRELVAREEERQQRLEAEARQAALEAERQAEQHLQQEIREQRRQRLTTEQAELRHQTILLSRRHRFGQARVEYAVMAASSEQDFSRWASNQIAMLEQAEKAFNTFYNTGEQLAGMRFVPPDEFRPAQIVSIDRIMVTSEFVETVYQAGEIVGERRRTVTTPINQIEIRRIINLIETAWRYQNGHDETELDLMIGSYLMSRGQMLETAETRLQQTRGTLARFLLDEKPQIQAAARQIR